MSSSIPAPAQRLLEYANASPTPFHAVAEGVARLEKAGFARLHERESWAAGPKKLAPGGKYYITRNQSSIIAFTVPPKLEAKKPAAISIVGCHTDSPRFIIKPVSRREKGGFAEVGVETYGGGIWATWMDRDLSIAGRVVVSGTSASKKDPAKQFTSHLILHQPPILRIPTVAIHLARDQNEKFYYNPETQQVPILALASQAFNESFAAETCCSDAVTFTDPLSITSHHHPILLHTIAGALSASLGEEVLPTQIHDFELSLFDTQLSTIGGALNEFIFSPRMDNLFSSYCAIEGLIESVKAENWGSDGRVSMIALWDNEEVGSVSAYGAESNFIEAVIERVAVALKKDDETATEAYQQTLAASFLLSCDMGHAAHPSFLDKHEDNHRPLINSGPAIKTNAKQRYATTSQTTFALRRIAKVAGVPLQEYEVRNDMACGSTIGPLVSKIGLRTVDIGCPMLSMHSIRETAGTKDVGHLINLFETFFDKFGTVDDLEVD